MTRLVMGLMVLSSLAFTGCDRVAMLHPLAEEADRVVDSDLVGRWEGDSGVEYATVTARKKKLYKVEVKLARRGPLEFEGALTRIDDSTFFCYGVANSTRKRMMASVKAELWKASMIPVFDAVLLERKGDTLRVGFIEHKWFNKQVKRGTLGVAGSPIPALGGDFYLLTAPTKELRAFFEGIAENEDAWKFMEPMKRVVEKEGKGPPSASAGAGPESK